MNIAFSGGRNIYPSRRMIGKTIKAVAFSSGYEIFPDVRILVGDCKTGVDKVVWDVCDTEYPTDLFEADWSEHKRAAGPIRNKAMIDEAHALIAFWDGKSAGTRNCIKCATDKGIPVLIIPQE